MKTSNTRTRVAARPAALAPKQARAARVPKAFIIALVAAIVAAAASLWWSWHQDHRPGAVHWAQGQAALNAGDESRAEQEWTRGIQADPRFAPDHVSLGDLYFGEKRYGEAAGQYSAATRLTPDDGLLFLKLDQADLGIGNVRAARAAARRAARLRPDDPDVQGLYGLLEAQCGDKMEALPALRRAHALEPDDPDYLHELVNLEIGVQDGPDAERDAVSWLAAHPNDPLGNYLMALIDAKKPPTPVNLQSALEHAQKARAEMPADPRVYPVLGELYLAINRPQDALKAFQAGVRLDPQSEPMLHGKIQCYTRLGQMQKASALAAQLAALSTLLQHIQQLQDDFQAEPANVDMGLALARIQEQHHLNADAESTLKNLLRAVPRNPRAHVALAAFYRLVGRPDLAQQAEQLNYVPPQEP